MDFNLTVLRSEAKKFSKNNPRILKRFLVLIELTKFRHKHGNIREIDFEQIAARFELSSRTLYRWVSAYSKGGAEALTPSKACGRRSTAVRGHTAKKIKEWRKLYNWGAEVIQAHLLNDFGIIVSQYKINRYLRKKGLLVRKRCKPRKKHIRVVKIDKPGIHTQIDVKHLPHLLPNGMKCYVYNFVDHASRWAFKKAYDSYGPSETRDFICQVIKTAPFTITRLQSDNGVEFTYKYLSLKDNPKRHALDEECERNGIRHVLIPPGEKELQGLVERSHRQDDEELFHRITPASLEMFNRILSQHCEWRNKKRRRKALNWKTSNEFLADYRNKLESWLYENGPTPFNTQAVSQVTEEFFVSIKKAA